MLQQGIVGIPALQCATGLLEGVMTFSRTQWLGIAALTMLIVINGIDTGCNLVTDRCQRDRQFTKRGRPINEQQPPIIHLGSAHLLYAGLRSDADLFCLQGHLGAVVYEYSGVTPTTNDIIGLPHQQLG